MKENLKKRLEKHLHGTNSATLDPLVTRLWKLPYDTTVVAIDLSVGLGGTSLRAAVELLRVVPDLAPLLTDDELRSWGEICKKLASTSPESALEFMARSKGVLEAVPQRHRGLTLQLVAKQAALSNLSAIYCFEFVPSLFDGASNDRLVADALAVGLELARLSVRHSVEFLKSTPEVLAHLDRIDKRSRLSKRAISLASDFSHRSGGTAAEFFDKLPDVTANADAASVGRLFDETEFYLEQSGSVGLGFFASGGVILRTAGPAVFESWSRVSRIVSKTSNASTYNFLKFSPHVVSQLVRLARTGGRRAVLDVLDVIERLSQVSPQAAVECFRSCPRALSFATNEQFERWAFAGLERFKDDQKKLQAYFALESRRSKEALESAEDGLHLDTISSTLRLYIEGLTGKQLTIAPQQDLVEELAVNDGTTIFLPSTVTISDSEDENFRLFKVLAAHGAGQIQFGTYDQDSALIRTSLRQVRETLRHLNPHAVRLKKSSNYADVLRVFPDRSLARRIFTTLENGRIETQLRATYRGLRRDLNFVRSRLFESRESILALPSEELLHELLLQAAVGGGITAEGRSAFGVLADEIQRIATEYVLEPGATVGDTLVATALVYKLVISLRSDTEPGGESDAEVEADESDEQEESDESQSDRYASSSKAQPAETTQVAHWSQSNRNEEATDFESAIPAQAIDAPEQALEPGDVAYFYDEWDRELGDHRIGWCRIIERKGSRGSRSFVDLVRSRYSGAISSIRYQFQLMRLDSLRRIRGELDGEDFDLQAVIDYAIDKIAIGRIDERLYTRKLRRERDVAVSFLLDLSSSTARTISRFPNQPYSHPGRRIIDIEKEGLVVMSEALEAVGDLYSMYGFSSEGRRNVKFYIFKDFDETYTADVERRIGGISYQNNTRLGSAIRHAAARLADQTARTKLLIVLSDGRPYDHDYGDSRYAREDTKVALRQAKQLGMTPFCITIDRESEEQLRDMYGEVGYTIIDDVLSLPERMPGIYRRLTT